MEKISTFKVLFLFILAQITAILALHNYSGAGKFLGIVALASAVFFVKGIRDFNDRNMA